MRRARTHLIAATAIWLAGCADDAALDAREGTVPRELLQGIEINRIGRHRLQLREFQDRAMAEAVAYIMDRGVSRQRIERITVQTLGGARTATRGGVRRAPIRYTVWLRIEGCRKSVQFSAAATGRIRTPSDTGGCLAAGDPPAQ